jgi:hypothetical protein
MATGTLKQTIEQIDTWIRSGAAARDIEHLARETMLRASERIPPQALRRLIVLAERLRPIAERAAAAAQAGAAAAKAGTGARKAAARDGTPAKAGKTTATKKAAPKKAAAPKAAAKSGAKTPAAKAPSVRSARGAAGAAS